MAIENAPGNKLVIGANAGGNLMALVRLNSDGSFDTTFDTNGIKRAFTAAPLNNGSTFGEIAVDSQGRIVVVGSANLTSIGLTANTPFIARFTSAGALDTSFGGSGFVTVTGQSAGRFEGVDIDTSDRITTVSQVGSISGSNASMFIVRVNPDGTFDNTFSGDGVQTFAHPTEASATPTSVKLDSSGRAYVGINHSSGGASLKIGVARITSSGNVDTTFGTNGYATINVPPGITSGSPSETDLEITQSGLIATTGNDTTKVFIARLTQNGTIDTTFDVDGFNGSAQSGQTRRARAVVELADGRLVIAGEALQTSPANQWAFLAAFKNCGT
jgi:uncharacterized delta-60 repeat protein